MNKKIGNIFKGDKVVWMIFFFLCMVSIVEVFSASSGLTYKSQNYIGPIIYHAGTIMVGVLVAIITLNIPCRYFKLMTPFLMLISAVTLLWVLLAGTKVGDAGRWISLFGFTFQPSEIAKGTIVLAVAQVLAAMQRDGPFRRLIQACNQGHKDALAASVGACNYSKLSFAYGEGDILKSHSAV